MRLVTHNAFWFQGRPFETAEPGAPDVRIVTELVALYRELKPDLLCLQEVQDQAAADLLSEALELPAHYCPGGELPQYGVASLGLGLGQVSDSRMSAGVTQRAWMISAVRLNAEKPLAVANCHLPSPRQLGEEAAAACRIREMEAVLESGDRPGVILGDFNEQPGGPLGEFLSRGGYRDAAVVSGKENQGTTPGNYRGDQIWVHDDLRESIAGYGVVPEERLLSAREDKTHHSDHWPVWVELEMD